jgi:hypothetical protein
VIQWRRLPLRAGCGKEGPCFAKDPARMPDPTPSDQTTPEAAALPDRLSVNPASPFFHDIVTRHEIGIRFNGVEKTNVEEYCLSEGWIRVAAGKAKDRFGMPMTIKLTGKVEAWVKG